MVLPKDIIIKILNMCIYDAKQELHQQLKDKRLSAMECDICTLKYLIDHEWYFAKYGLYRVCIKCADTTEEHLHSYGMIKCMDCAECDMYDNNDWFTGGYDIVCGECMPINDYILHIPKYNYTRVKQLAITKNDVINALLQRLQNVNQEFNDELRNIPLSVIQCMMCKYHHTIDHKWHMINDEPVCNTCAIVHGDDYGELSLMIK